MVQEKKASDLILMNIILMNKGTKILNELLGNLGNRIQQCYVKRIVQDNHCDLSQEEKAGSVFQNQEI